MYGKQEDVSMLLLRTHHKIKIAGPKYKERLQYYYNGWDYTYTLTELFIAKYASDNIYRTAVVHW